MEDPFFPIEMRIHLRNADQTRQIPRPKGMTAGLRLHKDEIFRTVALFSGHGLYRENGYAKPFASLAEWPEFMSVYTDYATLSK